MTNNRKTLIFTDLDGTLLDHDTYEWSAASEALNKAHELEVPVIPCTSKTLAECLVLQNQLSLTGPVIFENGAGVALPKSQFDRPTNFFKQELDNHWVCGFSCDYDSLREKVSAIKRNGRFVFKGFGDMNTQEIASHTDLPLERAALAKQRLHTEPLLWMDDAKSFNRFHDDVTAEGLSLIRGGRFIHVLESCDKGKTMNWLAQRYDPAGLAPPYIIAAGDSPNDIPMLEQAHAAVLVKNPHRSALKLTDNPDQIVIRTEKTGPEGWNKAILELLTKEPAHG